MVSAKRRMPSRIHSGFILREIQAEIAIPQDPFIGGKENYCREQKATFRFNAARNTSLLTISLRQPDPQEQATLRSGPVYSGREELFQWRPASRFAVRGKRRKNLPDMPIQESIARRLVRHHLNEDAGVQIGALFDLHQFSDHLRRAGHPCQTQTPAPESWRRNRSRLSYRRRIRLRCPAARRPTPAKMGRFRLRSAARNTGHLHNRDIKLIGEFHQDAPPLQRERDAPRILEGGLRVEKFGAGAEGIRK